MERLATDNRPGITSGEAIERLQAVGPNTLPEPASPGLLRIFLSQFKSPFIYVLLVAALVSLGLGQTVNSIFIFAVLLINAVIGTVQEFSAERAAAALRNMVPYRASVVRDGVTQVVDTADIVPGDYVLLASGDRIPADLRLATARELLVDESMLTGESIATLKDDTTRVADDAPLGDRSDVCFAGTVVMSGRGEGTVEATGAATEIGKIAADLPADEEVKPPLLLRIEQFTLRITYGILVLVALIFLITVIRGEDLATVFLLGVALAVSAIPEGLPAAMTVALAVGMRRMARRSVIIRRLLAVESLGSCTFVASDKTGTLTVNEMTVRRIVLPDGAAFDVSGEGLDLHGMVAPQPDTAQQAVLERLCHAGLLANEAELKTGKQGREGQGDGVDIALLVLAGKLGLQYAHERSRFPQLGFLPYESSKACSASVNHYADGYEIFVKGSVERLLSMCGQSDAGRLQRIEEQADELAGAGYRVLGLAHRRVEIVPAEPAEFLADLEFIGMVGMIDPLRPEAITAVQACKEAHISVAMITGDHPRTARALAMQLGIADEAMPVVTGPQIRQAHDGDGLQQLVNSTRVYARIEPHQKKQIVEQLIEEGEFVAVTGDGVNDAPALNQAHVGVAMGLRGTDVARESADIIITDDRFSSIVEGIKQGRIVYSNIRKVIFLLVSTGAAEITLVMLSLLFGMPLPLFPLQLLWLNLVTNGVQHIALAMEPEEGNELRHPPRPPDEPVFNRLMIERVLINAVVMGCLAFAVFTWQMNAGASESAARNMTLLLMVLFENVHVLNSRSETVSIFRQSLFGNRLLLLAIGCAQAIHIGAMYTPGLREILQVEPVALAQWSQLLMVALVLIVVDELHKGWHQRAIQKVIA